MPPDPTNQSSNENLQPRNVPPPLPAPPPPIISPPPALNTGSPPPLPPEATGKPRSAQKQLAILLSICLGLFLADAIVSLVDDSLILFFRVHLFTAIRGVTFFFAILIALLVYCLMALAPTIPKRVFLPVTLFNPAASLLVLPFLIYFYGHIQQVSWGFSLCQLIFGLGMLFWLRRSFKFGWPLVDESQLESRRFSWLNLIAFLLMNLFVLLPVVLAYLFVCSSLAIHHFSEGFISLRPGGLTVQARKYIRNDGKTIQLVPMAHVGEADFYRKLSRSFPTNSLILMEGVSDDKNLLTNKITYKRMATSLGLAEQQKEFKPRRAQLVRADVDVEQFTTNTIDFLNMAMLIHSKGLSADTITLLMQYSPPPQFEEQLFDDILRKRNRHLLKEIEAQLSESESLIVPWGAAHMPEIAQEIQKSGFHLVETHDYEAIRFRSRGKDNKR